jgi:hypothetical protein
MTTPETPISPPLAGANKWWHWSLLAIGIWVIPAGMMGVWGCCYTEVFGEPPCGAWAEKAIDFLFFCNFVLIGVLLFRSRQYPGRFLLAYSMSVVEVAVTVLIWYFGGLSVWGFYF